MRIFVEEEYPVFSLVDDSLSDCSKSAKMSEGFIRRCKRVTEDFWNLQEELKKLYGRLD